MELNATAPKSRTFKILSEEGFLRIDLRYIFINIYIYHIYIYHTYIYIYDIYIYHYIIKELQPIRKVKSEVAKCCLWFYNTRTRRIYHSIKVISKCMFS